MTPDLLASTGTDIGTVSLALVAVAGFGFSIINGRRTTSHGFEAEQGDRIQDLIRQRDEARSDLAECEKQNRALRRAITKLANGHAVGDDP